MTVGLLWCFCAIVVFLGMRKTEKEKRGIMILFFIVFSFFGICGVLGAVLRSEILLYTSEILSCSVICFGLFYKSLHDKKMCNTKVVGVYRGAQIYKSVRGYRSYAPIFQYYYQGKEYQGQANENYSLKKITAYFTQGQSYTILVNENNPWQYVTGKSQKGKLVLLFLVGLFLLAGYVIMLLQ